jgi:hypothetical protein
VDLGSCCPRCVPLSIAGHRGYVVLPEILLADRLCRLTLVLHPVHCIQHLASVMYDQRPWTVGSTPLSVTRVTHFPFTLMQVPPGLKGVGNSKVLSEVTRWPCEKKRRCVFLASRSSAPVH